MTDAYLNGRPYTSLAQAETENYLVTIYEPQGENHQLEHNLVMVVRKNSFWRPVVYPIIQDFPVWMSSLTYAEDVARFYQNANHLALMLPPDTSDDKTEVVDAILRTAETPERTGDYVTPD